MGGVASIFKKPQEPKGPSQAELMAQKEARDATLKDRAEQERLRALAQNARGRRRSLSFVDASSNTTLGG